MVSKTMIFLLFLCICSGYLTYDVYAAENKSVEVTSYLASPNCAYDEVSAANLSFTNFFLNPAYDATVRFDYRGTTAHPDKGLIITMHQPWIRLHSINYGQAGRKSDLILGGCPKYQGQPMDGGDIRLRTGAVNPSDRMRIDAYGKVIIEASDEININDPDTKCNLLLNGNGGFARIEEHLFIAPDNHARTWPLPMALMDIQGDGGMLVPNLITSDYMNDYNQPNPYRASPALTNPPEGLVLYDSSYNRLMMFHRQAGGFAGQGWWAPLLTRDEINVVNGTLAAGVMSVNTGLDFRKYPASPTKPAVVIRGMSGFPAGGSSLTVVKDAATTPGWTPKGTNNWWVTRQGSINKAVNFTVIAAE